MNKLLTKQQCLVLCSKVSIIFDKEKVTRLKLPCSDLQLVVMTHLFSDPQAWDLPMLKASVPHIFQMMHL